MRNEPEHSGELASQMPMVIHLGVIDQFYTTPTTGTKTPVSTGDVAKWLEDKYGIMDTFAKWNSVKISNDLTKSLSQAVRTAAMGGPVATNPFAAACAKIEQDFRKFLDNDEMANLGIPGTPTAAALAGKTARTKSGKYAKRNRKRNGVTVTLGEERPSFIYSGLYQASFKAWYAKSNG